MQRTETVFKFRMQIIRKVKNMDYKRITENLRTTIELSNDKRLCGFYAEYLVATKISEHKVNVKVLGKRRGPDLQIQVGNTPRLIEVKSSHTDTEGFTCAASFGKGKSIKQSEFYGCVFVVFEKLINPVEYFIFTLEELREVITKVHGSFKTTNPYILEWYGDLKTYEKARPKKEQLNIEIKLHKHPELFRNRWDNLLS